MFKAFRERRPWAAFIVNFIFSPVLGMLYLGRLDWALLYIVIPAVLLFAAIFGLSPDGFGLVNRWVSPIGLSALDLTALTIGLAAAFHCYILAKRLTKIPKVWYARWWGIVIIAPVLAFVPLTLVRTFVVQPFNIPSGSMLPTLEVGDILFAQKYPYGFNKYSFPFVLQPLFGTEKYFETEPKRGDIVIFKLPRENRSDYVKRVVGLPGDRIRMAQGRLVINGERVPQEQVEDYFWGSFTNDNTTVRQFVETLPNGVSYRTLDVLKQSRPDNTDVYVVPDEHYFVMGDNRDNATDSRFTAIGFIPKENIYARVYWIWFNTNQGRGKSVFFDH